MHRIWLEEAEIIKLCNNAFHTLKIGLGNDIGRLCDQSAQSQGDADGLCRQKVEYLPAAYLKPGFAFRRLVLACAPCCSRPPRRHRRFSVLEAVLTSIRLQIEALRIKLNVNSRPTKSACWA